MPIQAESSRLPQWQLHYLTRSSAARRGTGAGSVRV